MIVSAAILCMALNVYHEARGEVIPGQYAVAEVLWLRAEQDPNKVCEETFKHKQFSWANKGVVRHGAAWKLAARHKPRDEDAWYKALRISAMVMQNRGGFVKTATHFHTKQVKPVWRHAMTKIAVIGNHIFYRA